MSLDAHRGPPGLLDRSERRVDIVAPEPNRLGLRHPAPWVPGTDRLLAVRAHERRPDLEPSARDAVAIGNHALSSVLSPFARALPRRLGLHREADRSQRRLDRGIDVERNDVAKARLAEPVAELHQSHLVGRGPVEEASGLRAGFVAAVDRRDTTAQGGPREERAPSRIGIDPCRTAFRLGKLPEEAGAKDEDGAAVDRVFERVVQDLVEDESGSRAILRRRRLVSSRGSYTIAGQAVRMPAAECGGRVTGDRSRTGSARPRQQMWAGP